MSDEVKGTISDSDEDVLIIAKHASSSPANGKKKESKSQQAKANVFALLSSKLTDFANDLVQYREELEAIASRKRTRSSAKSPSSAKAPAKPRGKKAVQKDSPSEPIEVKDTDVAVSASDAPKDEAVLTQPPSAAVVDAPAPVSEAPVLPVP